MKPLTICYITSREKPNTQWLFESLSPQIRSGGEEVGIFIIDGFSPRLTKERAAHIQSGQRPNTPATWIAPKPTVFQGKYRLTKKECWAASNARNTGICLCETEWIAFLDDRCVLMPDWLNCIREAMAGNYAVFGSYEKRTGMTVNNGVIVHGGIVTGKDPREEYTDKFWGGKAPVKAPGEWSFGCTLALPLEWALTVNGYEELMDSLSAEDVVSGTHLKNNGFDLRYDKRMKIIEDRTPSELGTPMFRTSKERWPHDKEDKGHKALERFLPLARASHDWNLRQIRTDVLSGKPFPIPTRPTHDWFDGKPLSEL
jgi:hypothetical protein